MKIIVSLLIPVIGLTLLSSPAPARAGESAPGRSPFEMLLSGLLVASSSTSSAPAAGDQDQELQSTVTTLLKTLSQLSPDSTTSGLPSLASAASMFDLPGFLGEVVSPSPASGSDLLIQSSGPLRTGGLSPRLDDKQWRRQFQMRSRSR